MVDGRSPDISGQRRAYSTISRGVRKAYVRRAEQGQSRRQPAAARAPAGAARQTTCRGDPMGQTITEKILARARRTRCGARRASSSRRSVDLVLANDITAPLAIEEFRKAGAARCLRPRQGRAGARTISRRTRTSSPPSSAQMMREFAREHGPRALLREVRTAWASSTSSCPRRAWSPRATSIIGADSHTCTYGALGAFCDRRGHHRPGLRPWPPARSGCACRRASGSSTTASCSAWVGGKDLILYTIGKIGVDGALYRAMEFSGAGHRARCSMDGPLHACATWPSRPAARTASSPVDETTLEYLQRAGAPAQRRYTVYAATRTPPIARRSRST